MTTTKPTWTIGDKLTVWGKTAVVLDVTPSGRLFVEYEDGRCVHLAPSQLNWNAKIVTAKAE